MEKNSLQTLVELIEKRATEKGYEMQNCKASFFQSIIQNILESSRQPEQVIQIWIASLSE